MKMKGIFGGRRKKSDSSILLKNVSLHEESTLPSNNSGDNLDSSTFSSEEEQPQGEFVLKKYSENVDGSAMSMFARMSTTIAETLSEKEFGKQKNSLYRPNSNSYSSKVVHPVLCKRDIFVKSVTPTKPKSRRTRALSIYYVEDKEPYMMEDKETQDTTQRNSEKEVLSKNDSRRTEKKKKPQINQGKVGVKQDDSTRRREFHRSTDGGENRPASYSITASMLFRERKQLSVETGRIVADDSQHMPTNRHRLYHAPKEEHCQTLRDSKDWTKPPRYAGAPVSPSSTVSSLTIPAELEFDPTPKALFHQQIKPPPQLEGIQEQYDCDDMTKSQSHRIQTKDNESDEI